MTNSWEEQYLNLIADILQNGDDRVDRTGVGTRAVFGRTLDIPLWKGFPAVTTKKLAWRAVTSELLWFLEGSDDERRLAEILHGTRDESKKTIWADNAQASYWKPKANFDGDLGRVYGVQWRGWKRYVPADTMSPNKELYWEGREMKTAGLLQNYVQVTKIDQVADVIQKIRSNPTDRRMIISAWNVAEIDQMALPPCHMMAQFFVAQGRRLSCQMYQRSVDTMLGLPFNIASYALLVHMIAQVTNCVPDRLILNLGDTHIYSNHIDAARSQLTRQPSAPPTLLLNTEVSDIDDFRMSDFALENYTPQESIKMEMAV